MPIQRILGALLCLLLISVVAFSAAAQKLSAEDRATARELYDKATYAYDHGDYRDALKYWTEAYDLTNATILLYSIGNAHERLGNLEEAIEALEGYKSSVRDREENEVLELRIINLQERWKAQKETEQLRQEALERERADAERREQELRAEQERLADELVQERLKELRRDPKGLQAVRWTSISLAGGALITGAVFSIRARAANDSLKEKCRDVGGGYMCLQDQRDEIRTHDRDQRIAAISYGVAGGLGLLGISLLFVHPNRDKTLDDLTLEPAFYGDGAGARLRWNF